jgi:hypothetical protein
VSVVVLDVVSSRVVEVVTRTAREMASSAARKGVQSKVPPMSLDLVRHRMKHAI